MIYAEIQNLLVNTTTPEVVSLFDRAAKVFEDLNFEDWLDVLANVVGDLSDEGDSEVVDIMRLRVNEMLDSILMMHGVVLTSEATLGDRLAIAEALSRVSGYDDKSSLLLEVESNTSAPEVLAGVVALLSDMRVEATLAVVEDVSDGFKARLREIIEGQESEQLEEIAILGDQIRAYEKYKIVFANDVRWCDRFAQFPQAFGLPFDAYVKYYLAQQVENDLVDSADTQMAWRRICINLIGIGCLSAEGVVKTADNAKRYLEQICTDLGQVTQMYAKLTNLLLEFNRAQT